MKIKSTYGYCLCCKSHTEFSSSEQWLRDHYICEKCGSIPRERALMKVISDVSPDFQKKKIHESSPCGRGASLRLMNECEQYISSHYWADEDYCEEPHLNINLEDQKLGSESFDLVVTQDVFEHLPNPIAASREIFRTLKPGGFLIQTVPLVNRFNETQQWAKLNSDNDIEWLYEPDIHGNPIDPENGSPVFWHYGYDFVSNIDKWAGFKSIIILNQIERFGIEGELCEVIVSQKKFSTTTRLKQRMARLLKKKLQDDYE